MQIIQVVGLASGTVKSLKVDDSDLSANLLDWLRAQGITIASSCDGEGVCKKCSIQKDWLTCQLTLKDLFECQPNGRVEVAYL